MIIASIVLEQSESDSGEDNPISISNNEDTVSDVVLNPLLSPDQTGELQNFIDYLN